MAVVPKLRTKEYMTEKAAVGAAANLKKKKYTLVYVTRETRWVLRYHK